MRITIFASRRGRSPRAPCPAAGSFRRPGAAGSRPCGSRSGRSRRSRRSRRCRSSGSARCRDGRGPPRPARTKRPSRPRSRGSVVVVDVLAGVLAHLVVANRAQVPAVEEVELELLGLRGGYVDGPGPRGTIRRRSTRTGKRGIFRSFPQGRSVENDVWTAPPGDNPARASPPTGGWRTRPAAKRPRQRSRALSPLKTTWTVWKGRSTSPASRGSRRRSGEDAHTAKLGPAGAPRLLLRACLPVGQALGEGHSEVASGPRRGPV